MSLDYVEIWAEDANPPTPGMTFPANPVPLSNSEVMIVSGIPEGTSVNNRINIYFQCGTTNSLTDFSPATILRENFYYVDINIIARKD
jgi:hypothetical protein